MSCPELWEAILKFVDVLRRAGPKTAWDQYLAEIEPRYGLFAIASRTLSRLSWIGRVRQETSADLSGYAQTCVSTLALVGLFPIHRREGLIETGPFTAFEMVTQSEDAKDVLLGLLFFFHDSTLRQLLDYEDARRGIVSIEATGLDAVICHDVPSLAPAICHCLTDAFRQGCQAARLWTTTLDSQQKALLPVILEVGCESPKHWISVSDVRKRAQAVYGVCSRRTADGVVRGVREKFKRELRDLSAEEHASWLEGFVMTWRELGGHSEE